MNLDLGVPAGKFSYGELEGDISADGSIVNSWSYCDGEWLRNDIHDHNDSRLCRRLEVACEPNGGVGSESKLMDHPVPSTKNVPEVYRMISSRSISMWGLHFRAGEVKIMGCEGFHRDSGMVRALVKQRWAGEDRCSQGFQRNTPNVLEGTCTAR